jgi:hypothetical protein
MDYKKVLIPIILYNVYSGYNYLCMIDPDSSFKKRLFYSSINGIVSVLPFGLVNMFRDFYDQVFFSIYKNL